LLNRLIAKVEKWPGSVLVFLAAVLWSTAGGVTKSFTLDAVLLPGIRSLIAGLVFLPFLRPKKIVWDRWLFGMVISYTSLVVLILCSLRFTTAANALALQFTSPMWIMLVSIIVQRKLPSFRRFLPVGIMLVGIVIMLLEPNEGGSLLGNIMAILAGAAFAGVSICLPHVKAGGYLSMLSFINLCVAAIVLIPLAIAPNYTIHVPLSTLPYIFFLAVFQLSGGYFFYSIGMNKVSAQKATILCAWEFILTPVWAYLLVGELPSVFGAVGWVILLAAILLEGRLGADPPAETETAPKEPAEQRCSA